MKTYKIKIRRGSIKKNPHAGQTRYRVPMNMECSIEIDCPHRSIEDQDKGIALMSCRYDIKSDGRMIPLNATYKIYKSDAKSLDKLLKQLSKQYKNYLTVHINQVYQEIDSTFPEPEYLYEYRPKQIQCYNCCRKCDYKELINEYGYSGESQYVDYDVLDGCPHCGIARCCTLEFETIDEILVLDGVPGKNRK